MRILQIFNRYALVGGEELAFEQFGERLSRRHEVREVTFDSAAWSRRRDPLSRVAQSLLMACNPMAVARVRRVVREWQPDVIVLHNLMPVGSSALHLWLALAGCPTLQVIHNFRPFSVNGYCWADGRIEPSGLWLDFLPEIRAGAWQGSRFRTAWYGAQLWALHRLGAFRAIRGWLAISSFMAETFARAGVSRDKIAVIPHAWESAAVSPSPPVALTGDPIFVYLGRLSEEKGVLVVLEAWRRFITSGAPGKLVIGGDGPLRGDVEAAASSLERCEYRGFVNGDEKDDLLKNCRALVIPSVWWEPAGLVIYEAYERGKPVLAARSAGIMDYVRDGRTAWCHAPGDSEELAEHLQKAAADAGVCEAMGLAGREFLAERTAERWLDQFDELAGRVASGPPSAKPVRQRPARHDTPVRIMAYLADQNPNMGRSLGISRMTRAVLERIASQPEVELEAVVSKSSMAAPVSASRVHTVPWNTRRNLLRALTDNLHPLLMLGGPKPDVWYFPKGFMPRIQLGCSPAVATVHDTMIQYYQDHYPNWRTETEWSYWITMLKNTLRDADAVMTVSEHARGQIQEFIRRHGLPEREIHVTWEPCLYESIPQPEHPAKGDYVLHLGSREPHKRTAWLVKLWAHEVAKGRELPRLHVVGSVPEEAAEWVESTESIVVLPFLEDRALVSQFMGAQALIFPSEIEGFGLPALEAYYLGTPVCFTRGTSVEEVLAEGTARGGFRLEEPQGLFAALEDVTAMAPEEVQEIGLKLRETYAAERVVERMMAVFHRAARPMARARAEAPLDR